MVEPSEDVVEATEVVVKSACEVKPSVEIVVVGADVVVVV